MPTYLALKNPLIFDFKGARYREQTYADLIAKAKAEGRDGVIFKNTYDKALRESEKPITVYGAFEPEQIKSATGNRGTFDPRDPNITAAAKPEDESESSRQKGPDGYSLANDAQGNPERVREGDRGIGRTVQAHDAGRNHPASLEEQSQRPSGYLDGYVESAAKNGLDFDNPNALFKYAAENRQLITRDDLSVSKKGTGMFRPCI
jgi:hypothetical protein